MEKELIKTNNNLKKKFGTCFSVKFIVFIFFNKEHMFLFFKIKFSEKHKKWSFRWNSLFLLKTMVTFFKT
jgi:hypothetical protein